MNTAKSPPTLIEFLEDTGAGVRIYDMGRRVSEISRADFLAFERTDSRYPLPMQRQAWFALVQIREDIGTEPVIWFLRLQLDEQGKLLQANRDYMIHRFIELIAEADENATQADLGKALEDNPYTFTPREDRMAVFHARFSHDLGRPPSRYFAHAREYFSGRKGWDQWNFVGYQGIADLAVDLENSETVQLLGTAIPQLPDEPLIALCHCLENAPLPSQLEQTLNTHLQQTLTSDQLQSSALPTALLRALSCSPSRNRAVSELLDSPFATDIELLATIAGRAWESLQDHALATRYLTALTDEAVAQEVFNQCLGDLLSLPGMQDPLLGVLRQANRSEALARAFQNMTQTVSEQAK